MVQDNWYVLSVRSRYEKKIEEKINTLYKGVEAFCPVINSTNKDTSLYNQTNIPFFKGVIFVKAKETKLHNILEIPGVKKFLNIKGEFVCVSNKDMNNMYLLCDGKIEDSEIYQSISKKINTKHDNNFIKKVFDNTIVLSHQFFNYKIEANLIVE